MKSLILKDLSFAVFDFETTGLYPEDGDQIIEIGIVLVEGLSLAPRTYQTFVNPGRPIPAASTKVNGITDKDVANAPRIADVMDEFLEFIGPRIWVAQNAKFDMGFVVKNLRDLQKPIRQNVVIDTIGLSKILFPYETHHNLDVLMSRMGIVRSGDRHRSLDDCRYTAQILIEFIRLLDKQGVTTLPEVESAFVKPDSLKKSEKPKTRNLFG